MTPAESSPEPDDAGDPDTDAELRVQTGASAQPAAELAPGDEVPAGAPGAAEGICRACGGAKIGADVKQCPVCLGSGTLEVGVG